MLNRAKESNSLLCNAKNWDLKQKNKWGLSQMYTSCDLVGGDAVCVLCVWDFHSPSHALTHTSPTHLHHPRNSPSSWLSLLCSAPFYLDLLFCQRELIEPRWAITFLSVPDPPDTNTVGVLLTRPPPPARPTPLYVYHSQCTTNTDDPFC